MLQAPCSHLAAACLAMLVLAGCATAPRGTSSPARVATVTGSLIPQPVDAHGVPLAGNPSLRVYSSEDLDHALKGDDLGAALAQLDPSLTLSH